MSPYFWAALGWIAVSVVLLGLLSYMIGRNSGTGYDRGVIPILILSSIIWPVTCALVLVMLPFLWLSYLGESSK